jgi:hypothetical protein
MFLRQLPHLMERQGRSCVLAFLEIAKAYDTKDRDILVEARVGPGCPLALLLYLFVAQALLCWLQHCGMGIRLREQES